MDNNFDLFIDEILSIEFKEKNGVLDLSHYNQKTNYQTRLITLQQRAITELLRNPGVIDLQMKRLNQITGIFTRFWDWYCEQSLKNPYFFLELDSHLIVVKPFEKPISIETLWNLGDAVMLKETVLLGFIDQVNKLQLNGVTDPKPTGFQTNLNPAKLKPLFENLIEAGYISRDTYFKNFEACFNGLPLPDNFARVQWIKRPTKNKKTPAKKALTDLLILMGTPKEQIRDKTKLETCFCDPTGNPLIFTQSNFDNSKDNKTNSEYFPELQNIVGNL